MSVSETFSSQIQSKDSDLTAPENVMIAATTLLEALDGIAAKIQANFWAAPKTLASVQTFLKHILHSHR